MNATIDEKASLRSRNESWEEDHGLNGSSTFCGRPTPRKREKKKDPTETVSEEN